MALNDINEVSLMLMMCYVNMATVSFLPAAMLKPTDCEANDSSGAKKTLGAALRMLTSISNDEDKPLCFTREVMRARSEVIET